MRAGGDRAATGVGVGAAATGARREAAHDQAVAQDGADALDWGHRDPRGGARARRRDRAAAAQRVPRHGRPGVHDPRAVDRVRPRRAGVGGGLLDPVDHRLAPQPHRDQEPGHARHVRRGLRGPGLVLVAASAHRRQDVLGAAVTAPARGRDRVAGAEAREAGVERALALAIHRGHAHERTVQRRRLLAERERVVAGRRHHHDAGVQRPLDRVGEGGVAVAHQRRVGPQREIDHLRSVRARVVDPGGHVLDAARAVGVQHPHHQHVGLGRHTLHADAVVRVGRHDPRHVRAVVVRGVLVGGVVVAVDEVVAGDQAPRQVGVGEVRAGVHHRDRGSLALGDLVGGVRPDHRHAPLLRVERIVGRARGGDRHQKRDERGRDEAPLPHRAYGTRWHHPSRCT